LKGYRNDDACGVLQDGIVGGGEVIEAKIEKIFPTKIWIESGMMGERAVMMQHEGCEPFEYAVFNYNYAYTSNSGTHAAAESLARSLGCGEVIEHRLRPMTMPTADEVREQIAILTEMLNGMEAA
jgi:hypothetical protein